MDSLERLWQRTAPPNGDAKPPSRTSTKGARRVLLAVVSILALFILLNMAKGFYTDWLWFRDLGYGSVYGTVLGTKVLIFFVSAIIFSLLFLGNLLLAMRLAPGSGVSAWPWLIINQLQRMSRWSIIIGAVLVGLIFGMIAQENWLTILRFFNGQPFGINDPVFNKEIAFYVFSLPFLHLLRGWLMAALIVTLLGSTGIYALSYVVQKARFDFARPVLIHIGGLLLAILGLFAWGYRLAIWELVFSERGVVFGASYADMHAKLPAQWVLFAVVIILVGFIVVAVVQRRVRWALYGLGGWIAAAIIVGSIFPAMVQRFQVQPNELARETPYIEYNIEYTREAFALDRVEEKSFAAEDMPSLEELAENTETIENIRLWDHRPLKDTYNQIQAIRLYYDFNDVDVDRYIVDGEYRQVMLSARELSAEKLSSEAQTWVNRRIQFTHGYGLALSPVNEVTPEGLPELWVKDIPPVGDFQIERPQIYYGEKTDDYVIVGTKTEEFDYPAGGENIYGRYEGETGISLQGFIRRVAYAWQLGDFNILISSELTPESRLLLHRDIQERVRRLAPFLWLDDDPYLVIEDGRLLWIQDAYTVTDRYPYSQPLSNGLNYIRNSAKVVIDAYNGTTMFYIADAEDALIQTYQAIFPELFVAFKEMPEYLRAHRRYPEDMFSIQGSVYQTYHMQDARVFYNKEDLWAVPKEYYADREQLMEPYYITMRLPDEDEAEFLLMLPYTPVNKNNTIGWLAARCDGDNYGNLLAYHFPKERLVYGPSQIENRIQQDTVITEQLALWGRGGSRVIRGNLLLVPVGRSNLYVEPVFLQAETSGLPELKRVIVAAGDQIAMAQTLEESIALVFGATPPPLVAPEPEPETVPEEEPPMVSEPEVTVPAITSDLIEEFRLHYDRAMDYQKAGDWAGYGRELAALEAVLDRLEELTGAE